MPEANALDYIDIRNTISTYGIALDNKDFQLLKQAFTEDVEAVYPPLGGQVKGLQTMMEKLEKRLSPVTTHHALSTQTIEIAAAGKSASATTYYTGVHFGQGKWKGDQVTVYGKYVDTLVLTNGTGVQGASGKWLISKRDLVFMSTLGNPDVMKGETG